MLRSCLLAFLAAGVLVTEASAVIVLYLDDVDDARIINAVVDTDKVKESRKEVQELGKPLMKLNREALAAVLGKPAAKPAKTYAMPVGEIRALALSGVRKANDNRPDSDFVSFHPVGDFAAVEVYHSRYNQDGDIPLAVRIYLKIDKTFPKLTKDNLDQRLAWEQERLKKLAEHIALASPIANLLHHGACSAEPCPESGSGMTTFTFLESVLSRWVPARASPRSGVHASNLEVHTD